MRWLCVPDHSDATGVRSAYVVMDDFGANECARGEVE